MIWYKSDSRTNGPKFAMSYGPFPKRHRLPNHIIVIVECGDGW